MNLNQIRIFFSLSWLGLTLSLGIWWWILGIKQAKTIAAMAGSSGLGSDFAKVDRMLRLEGSFFLAMLLGGGLVMAYLSYRDTQRARWIADFFSTLTHEMKTPMASLQLQLEGLLADTKNKKLLGHYQNLWKENQRIQSRMDKAFYLASLMRGEQVFLQWFTWEELVSILVSDYPNVLVKSDFEKDEKIFADKRALELILKNLFENSHLHGKASSIELHLSHTPEEVQIEVLDNGSGFSGDSRLLGKPFQRITETSGSGIGLFVAQELLKKMKGSLVCQNRESEKGFQVTLRLPKPKK